MAAKASLDVATRVAYVPVVFTPDGRFVALGRESEQGFEPFGFLLDDRIPRHAFEPIRDASGGIVAVLWGAIEAAVPLQTRSRLHVI